MAFIDQRLPTKVELNAVRHDEEDIEIVTTDGGWETRNARQSSSLRSWDISFPAGFYDDATIAAVVAMYKAARGKLHSFRFKDPVENAIADAQFGTGDGTTTIFPLLIPYAAGSGYSVNYATGVVTFSPAPSVGVVLSWSGDYDVPVRFDSALDMTALTIRLAHIETLTIKEVRE